MILQLEHRMFVTLDSAINFRGFQTDVVVMYEYLPKLDCCEDKASSLI